VYDDERIAAFLDLYPIHPGHTLVVPKLHATDLLDCPAETVGRLLAVSRELAPAVVAATGAAGFNVWTATGAAAGQEVFHLHLHLLPRFADDTFGLRFPTGYPAEASRADLDVMAERISARL